MADGARLFPESVLLYVQAVKVQRYPALLVFKIDGGQILVIPDFFDYRMKRRFQGNTLFGRKSSGTPFTVYACAVADFATQQRTEAFYIIQQESFDGLR